MIWVTVLGASLACYLLKLLGYVVSQHVLEKPAVLRVTALIPVGFLAALLAVQTVAGDGGALTIDARVAGLATALVALLLRAPFLLVIIAAAATAALTRALGLMA